MLEPRQLHPNIPLSFHDQQTKFIHELSRESFLQSFDQTGFVLILPQKRDSALSCPDSSSSLHLQNGVRLDVSTPLGESYHYFTFTQKAAWRREQQIP